MPFAPVAVFGAMANTVADLDVGVFLPLLKLICAMYAAVAFLILSVLVPIALYARLPIGRFLRAVAEPVAIAFATASSEATLPLAMEKMSTLGVEEETTSFVLVTGSGFTIQVCSLLRGVFTHSGDVRIDLRIIGFDTLKASLG